MDAFTPQPFGGNGCAVVYEAEGLSDETCMSIVRETSLVECTFLSASDVADIKVRYFLATREIPFAGHPTVATLASLVDRGVLEQGALTLETQAGIIPVEVHIDAAGVPIVTMTQNAPHFGERPDPGLVAAVGGISEADLLLPPQAVSTGLPFVVTVLKDQAALRKLRMDVEALSALRASLSEDDADAMEPFWVTLSEGGTFSRLLLAPPMPAEDPFTGSATGAMATFLWREGLVKSPSFVAEQGHWMGRPGRAEVEVLGLPEDIRGVRVSGQAHILMRGELRL